MRMNKLFAALFGLTTAVLAFGTGVGGAEASPRCQRHPDYARAGYVWRCDHWERARAKGPICKSPRNIRIGYVWRCDHWERARADGRDVRDHRWNNGPNVRDHRRW